MNPSIRKNVPVRGLVTTLYLASLVGTLQSATLDLTAATIADLPTDRPEDVVPMAGTVESRAGGRNHGCGSQGRRLSVEWAPVPDRERATSAKTRRVLCRLSGHEPCRDSTKSQRRECSLPASLSRGDRDGPRGGAHKGSIHRAWTQGLNGDQSDRRFDGQAMGNFVL